MLDGPTEEQLQRIKIFDDMYRVIRDATGVEDAVKMVARFDSQIETMKHLTVLKTEGESMILELQKKHAILTQELASLKYKGESELSW